MVKTYCSAQFHAEICSTPSNRPWFSFLAVSKHSRHGGCYLEKTFTGSELALLFLSLIISALFFKFSVKCLFSSLLSASVILRSGLWDFKSRFNFGISLRFRNLKEYVIRDGKIKQISNAMFWFGCSPTKKKNKETTCEDFLLEELGASMGQAPAQFYSAGVIIVRQFSSVIWNLWRCTDRSVTRFPSSPRRRCWWASSAFELWGPRCRGASYWGSWCWRACPVAHDAPTWSSWRCRRRWRTCTPPCCACPTLLSSWWYELLWQVLWRWRRWWWWLLPSSLFKGDRGIEFPRLDGEHIDLGIIIVNSKAFEFRSNSVVYK